MSPQQAPSVPSAGVTPSAPVVTGTGRGPLDADPPRVLGGPRTGLPGWCPSRVRTAVGELGALVRLVPRTPVLTGAARAEAVAVTAAPTGLQRAPAAGTARPVVLVHGYLTSDQCWDPLLPHLRRAGFHDVTTLRYDTLRTDITQAAAVLARAVRTLVRRSGADGVHLIGYSLGGLAVRYAVQRLGTDAEALGAITVATPHQGTVLARAAVGPAAGQMRTGSALLAGLPAIGTERDVRWSLIAAKSDPVVSVSSATAGHHAASVCVPGCGHLSVIASPHTADAVIRHLLHVEAGDRTGGGLPLAG
ncbi:hypothetical protein GCM10010358_14140 [Streptomyces minutiscleroticus]|uniref:Lipase n=2 Tax=Streptomyces TaxID=1883 RepID=A0A918KGK0_9ACTN|nr:alpha/beta fold hydrolase [Streptomyces minutiscleroticus]GGX60754.1 hypothetical protein GCM10010358_14140 [Streptomyces minutiscleroticus]